MAEEEDADAALEVMALRSAAENMAVGSTLDSNELQSLWEVVGGGDLAASPAHVQQQQQLAMQLTSPFRQLAQHAPTNSTGQLTLPTSSAAPAPLSHLPAPLFQPYLPMPDDDGTVLPMAAALPPPILPTPPNPHALQLLQLHAMQSKAAALQQQSINNATTQQQLPISSQINVQIPTHLTTMNRKQCVKCGGSAKLERGAGRDMYKYACQDCAHLYNVSRIPNADGSYNVHEIGPRRQCNYTCGLCGACPKKGHICPGKVSVAEADDDDDHDDDAVPTPQLAPIDVESAKRALENANTVSALSASVAPKLAPTLKAVPEETLARHEATTLAAAATEAMAPTVTPMNENANTAETKEDEDDESEHEDAWPVGKTRVRVDGRIEICKMRQIVRHGVPCKGMEFYWDLLPCETAEEDAEDVGCKLGMEKKNAQQGMAASLVPPAQLLTGQDVYRKLGLWRKKVKGDGSCMYYATLANFDLCEHAHTRYERVPTSRDVALDAFLRQTTVAWMRENYEMLDLTAEETASIESHLVTPKYPLNTVEDFGTFATNINILALAAFVETPIVVWNRKMLLNPNTLQHVYDVDHDAAGVVSVIERYWSHEEVVVKAAERTLVHIEFDGIDHYSALVGTQAVPLLDHVFAALVSAKTATVPTASKSKPESKKRIADSDTHGWIELTNKYREVDDASTDIEVAKTAFDDLESQLADAKSKGFNAVMFLYNDANRSSVRKIVYIRYSGVVAVSSCQDTDVENTLFVFNDPKKKKQKVLPPHDSYSCCGLYRLSNYQSTEAIDCALCGKFFHVSCVVPTGMTKKQRMEWNEKIAPSWACDACDDSSV